MRHPLRNRCRKRRGKMPQLNIRLRYFSGYAMPERLREIMREAIATCTKIIKDVGIKVD